MIKFNLCRECKGKELKIPCLHCNGEGITLTDNKQNMNITNFAGLNPEAKGDILTSLTGTITGLIGEKQVPDSYSSSGFKQIQEFRIQDDAGNSEVIEFSTDKVFQNASMVTGKKMFFESVANRQGTLNGVKWIGGKYPKFRVTSTCKISILGAGATKAASNTSFQAAQKSQHMDVDELVKAQLQVAIKMHTAVMEETSDSELATACAAASISGVAHWWFGDKAPTGLQSTEEEEKPEEEQPPAEDENYEEDDDWDDEEEDSPIKTLYKNLIETDDSDKVKAMIKNVAPMKPLAIIKAFLKEGVIEKDPGAKTQKEAFAFLKELDNIPY